MLLCVSNLLFRAAVILLAALVLVLCLGTASAGEANRNHDLVIRLWADDVELSGTVEDLPTAHALRNSVAKALPGRPVYDRLTVDPIYAPLRLPPSEELVSLLFELGLSTVDGSLTVSSTGLAVSGLTDSQVTHAAFTARLRILGKMIPGRALFNRICIVTAEDLALPQPSRQRRALRPQPIAVSAIQFVALSDTDYGPPEAPRIVAKAVLAADLAAAHGGGEAETPLAKTPPAQVFESLDLVGFQANSHLVGSTHYDAIDDAVARVKSLPAGAGKVVLRGYPDQAGRFEYNDWLGRQRAQSVRRFFIEAGIPEDRLSIEIPETARGEAGLGKVIVLFPKPATTEKPLAGASEPAADGSPLPLTLPTPGAM